jgi:exo-beta-1,3-glucanase (GH17 family)/cellulose synthase/poly-beta-1,6-N-acetylglucosamine synthase-like glycosyltransferase
MKNRVVLASVLAAAVALVHAGLWWLANRADEPASYQGRVRSVSYSPYRAGQDPTVDPSLRWEDIDADMALLSQRTKEVRTYGASGDLALVPPAAAQYGLTVTVGAWIDTDQEKNFEEIDAAVALAQQYPGTVRRILIGNESILRENISAEDMVELLARAKSASPVPVSTAEPWHVWMDHPELATVADYIAIHVLPYWEGVAQADAFEHVFMKWGETRAAFPGKDVVITEVGWPTKGRTIDEAEPGLKEASAFLRQFLAEADKQGIDYTVMEAFDQPWKLWHEGAAGAYWGIYDVYRQPKVTFSGPVEERPHWPWLLLVSAMVGAFGMVFSYRKMPHLLPAGMLLLFALNQAVATQLVVLWETASSRYLTTGTTIVWSILVLGQLVALAVMLADGYELAELAWAQKLRRRFFASADRNRTEWPKVSVHLCIYNEPPAMVKLTLDSLASLDYPNLEVVVVDNNTKNEAVWKPVEAMCAKLGSRFKFFHLPNCPGAKAGALNFALQNTAPDAEFIAVVDSDYVVRPDWLKCLVPHFDRAEVGFVQAPQDHREWEDDPFKEMLNWEYAGFFHIGMVHRNERNAIIQHGTMTIVRRTALEAVGGWSEWTICEDAELGLRLMNAGYESAYVEERFGHGLVPDSYAGYKKQRFRWACGAVQILKKYGWSMLTGRNTKLTLAQRYHFVAGWLPWVADALAVLCTLGALVWSVGLVVAPKRFDFPLLVFMVPTFGLFAFKLMHGLVLYTLRVPCTARQRVGAALAGLSLSHTIGKAVIKGFLTNKQAFLRTPKCEDKPAALQALAMAAEELAIMVLLWIAAIAVVATHLDSGLEARAWALMLAAQSLPYAASVYTSMVAARAIPKLPTALGRPSSLGRPSLNRNVVPRLRPQASRA